MRYLKSKVSAYVPKTHFVLVLLLSVTAFPSISADKPFCKWGDCRNGVGERVYSTGNSAISNFESGQRSGYTIEVFKSGQVCESLFTKGKSNGLRYCQTSQGGRTYSYYQRNKQQSGSPYLSISSKGNIVRVGRWYPSGGTSAEIIDLGRLKLDHTVVRRTGLSLADSLPSWFSAPSDNQQFLDMNKIRKFVSGKEASSFQRADKKFTRTKKSDNCVIGNCKDGTGRYVWSDGNFTIANYVDGKREGYAVYSTKNGNTECERIYRNNTVTGLSVCKTVYKGKIRSHFSYMVEGKRDKEDVLLIANSDGKVTTYNPASENPDEDYKRLQRDFEAIRTASKPELRNQLSEEFRDISLPSKAFFNSRVKADSKLEARAESEFGCEFGDCRDGFGGYLYQSGNRYIGGWKNFRQDGYGIIKYAKGKRTCEHFRERSKLRGLQICLTDDSMARADHYLNGEKSGDSISWDAKSGAIIALRIWSEGKLVREDRINLEQMQSSWDALKNSRHGLMRSSFLSDEFLSLELPSDTQSQWLRTRELARASKVQSIPEEAPVKLGCISGNCKNGFGEFATRESTLTGNFRNGKISGYALMTRSESQCEALMRNGAHAGVEHCIDIDTGNHTFSEKNSSGLQAASITISKTGKLIDYKVYEDDKLMNVSLNSSKDKDRLAMLDFEFLAQQLQDLKKSSTQDFQSRKVAGLESVPEFVASDKATIDKKLASKPSAKPKANRGAQLEPPIAPRPKSNLQRLAYLVAELDAGSRQINFNYRLDNVRIDPKAFELVYEFTAMRPIRDLDTSVISSANQTAYCSSSKLKPFRDENMPARWSYVDADDQTFEVLTHPTECLK
ncbi:hypothetical protein N9V47_05325 [Luminiphilus sp.]|nr:hypothetical protein [Luminiphilus sp.]MDB2313058.1 hypothetical protein [Luminiphilus sp.]